MPRSRTTRGQAADTAPSAPALAPARSWLYVVGLGLLCGKVTLLPLVFDGALDMPFVVSKALLSHALAYLLAATIVAVAIRHGRHVLVFSPLHIPVAAFALASIVATALAVDTSLALFGTHARMLGLASILDFAVFYLGIVLLVRTRRDAAALIASALIASALVLAYEVIQLLGRDPFPWSIDSIQRPFSTLGQATALAQYLTVLAVGVLALGLLVAQLSLRTRALLALYSALLLGGAAATGTRSALLGLGAGSVMLVLLVWRLHPSARARMVSLAGAAAAIGVLAVMLLLTPLGARLATTIQAPGVNDDEGAARLEPSAAGRLALYEIAVDIVRERPVLGYGPDSFIAGVPRYRPEGAPDFIRQSLASSAHSWVGYVATSSGIVGVLCFTAIATIAVALVLRGGLRAPAVAGAAMIAAFFGTGLTTPNELGTEWLFWAAAGAVAASTATKVGAIEPGPRIRGAKRRAERRATMAVRWATLGLLAAAGGATLASWSAYDASRSARASQDARLGGRPPQAVDFGTRATRADPGRPAYWHILGLAYVATSNWRDAITAFERATTLAPYDARYIGDLATAQLLLANSGDASARPRARELGDRATQIDPNNPRAHVTRAVVMQVLGDLPEALRSVERALALDPESRNDRLYVIAPQVMLESGRPADAVRVAREGLAILGVTNPTVAIRIELARALVASGQPVEALNELEIALSLQPNNQTALRLRADIQAAR